jgi:hypothetical protein
MDDELVNFHAEIECLLFAIEKILPAGYFLTLVARNAETGDSFCLSKDNDIESIIAAIRDLHEGIGQSTRVIDLTSFS